MLNGNEWHELHGNFLAETQQLMTRADECVNHLDLIGDDRDAVECLLGTLQQIAGKADTAGVQSIADFARQLGHLLHFASAAGRLQPKGLQTLRQCLSLLSWQVELVDPWSGQLPLDGSEQQELLERFGCCGIGQLDGKHSTTVNWTPPLATALSLVEPTSDEYIDCSTSR